MDDEQGNTLEFEGICHYMSVDAGAINPTQNFVTLNINLELLSGAAHYAPQRFGSRPVRITIVDLTDEEVGDAGL